MACNCKTWTPGAQRGNVRAGSKEFLTKCYQVHSRKLGLVGKDGKIHRPEPVTPSDAGTPCYKKGSTVIRIPRSSL